MANVKININCESLSNGLKQVEENKDKLKEFNDVDIKIYIEKEKEDNYRNWLKDYYKNKERFSGVE